MSVKMTMYDIFLKFGYAIRIRSQQIDASDGARKEHYLVFEPHFSVDHAPEKTVFSGDIDMQDSRHDNALMYLKVMPRVLTRMDNLQSLTLPSFDIHVVHHHSVFGLHHIKFRDAHLSGQTEAELFTWIVGQTDIVSLPSRYHNVCMTSSLSTYDAQMAIFISHAISAAVPAHSYAGSKFVHT
ncbi:uncharacterized protein BT62DRAFT_1004656 [Guyanagaster necrorhizus]|uniref:Uncharacterized protein n=1 Tax=Guyanagaster necrorhizus TaxID=856835 RepID=A0A9P7VV19_9AGAR|nr:uncharacterized protein BT62DRAFT_1004656 [Guyanagaster necrorhizus MCA 3950]KAG7447883.1 hypothetical protein BT62DRAFT_1004656 [Guyanagaster necrorhizus MCA 3950]